MKLEIIREGKQHHIHVVRLREQSLSSEHSSQFSKYYSKKGESYLKMVARIGLKFD